MDLGPVDLKASRDGEEILVPRAAQAAVVPKERRVTLASRGPVAWLEKWAAKEPRETEAYLDLEAPRGLLESLESRDLGETLVMLGPVETRDNQVLRVTLAGQDSATQAPVELLERKASLDLGVLREAEVTLA